MSEGKVGALTPCYNEEATIALSVGALLPYIDHYVVVDTGSEDKTLDVLRHLFSPYIGNKLHIIEFGKLVDFNISEARNAGINYLRSVGCRNFFKIDADDVFYDWGAQKAVEIARELDENITLYTLNQWELYQNSSYTTLEWLEQLKENRDFWGMRMPPGGDPSPRSYPYRFDGSYGHARIYRMKDAVAMGKWTDEAGGLRAEDIYHPNSKRVCTGNLDEFMVHYGWARPVNKKLEKGGIWCGEDKKDSDIRVRHLETKWPQINKLNMDKFSYGSDYWPQFVLFPFQKHPEVVSRLLPKIKEVFVTS